MRVVVNTAHHAFIKYAPGGLRAVANIGMRLNYGSRAPGENYVMNSVYTGAPDGKNVYMGYINKFKQENPDSLAGYWYGLTYIRSRANYEKTGLWPSDDTFSSGAPAGCLNPYSTNPDLPDYWIDLRKDFCRHFVEKEAIAEGSGMGYRPKLDIMVFDGVGYVYTFWESTILAMKNIKNALREKNVLTGINLGGWNWTVPSGLPDLKNILNDLPQMTDLIFIEGLWPGDDPRDAGRGTDRSVTRTDQIIRNLRFVMDRNIMIALIPLSNNPTTFPASGRVIQIKNVQMIQDGTRTRLVVTCTAPHHIFPPGDVLEGSLGQLPAAYKSLEGVRYALEEVPGSVDKVVMRSGVPLNITDFSGLTSGRVYDYHSDSRLEAAFLLMAANAGHRVAVVGSNFYQFPWGGADSPENWWRWPEYLGTPTGEYRIDEKHGDVIDKMSRTFLNGTLTIYPLLNYVEIKLDRRLKIVSPFNNDELRDKSLSVRYTVGRLDGVSRAQFQLDKGEILTDADIDGSLSISALEAGEHTLRGWLTKSDGTVIPGTEDALEFRILAEGEAPTFPGTANGELVIDRYKNVFNPQNEMLTIPYTLNVPLAVSIVILNRQGSKVKTLQDGEQAPGSYSANWKGDNEAGDIVASGVYVVRIKAGSRSLTEKIVVIK
jgi:hypothetical protein